MSLQPIKAADVEACLAQRHKIVFPPKIESEFELHTRRYRARFMRSTTLPSIFIYNIFLIVHVLLLPKTAWLATWLHLGVVTPLIVFGGLLARLEPKLVLRETVAASVPIMMITQIMFIYALNKSEAADHYQYLSIMILVNMNVTLRPDFRFAVGTSIFMTGIYMAFLAIGPSPLAVKLIGSSSMVAAAYVTLVANRRMERDARFAFLRRLQDRIYRVQAEAAAHRDALTGLSNRRHLDDCLTKLWLKPDIEVSPVAVLMIDVDHFKAYNDRYGHPAGDVCLRRVAEAIASELRTQTGVAVRFGGEEFLVLLPKTDLSNASSTAERIRHAVEGLAIPHESLGSAGVITTSVGVIVGAVSVNGSSELIAGADAALYAAKRNGRNRVWPPFSRAQDGARDLVEKRVACVNGGGQGG